MTCIELTSQAFSSLARSFAAGGRHWKGEKVKQRTWDIKGGVGTRAENLFYYYVKVRHCITHALRLCVSRPQSLLNFSPILITPPPGKRAAKEEKAWEVERKKEWPMEKRRMDKKSPFLTFSSGRLRRDWRCEARFYLITHDWANLARAMDYALVSAGLGFTNRAIWFAWVCANPEWLAWWR